jgi:hypothetical protein
MFSLDAVAVGDEPTASRSLHHIIKKTHTEGSAMYDWV